MTTESLGRLRCLAGLMAARAGDEFVASVIDDREASYTVGPGCDGDEGLLFICLIHDVPLATGPEIHQHCAKEAGSTPSPGFAWPMGRKCRSLPRRPETGKGLLESPSWGTDEAFQASTSGRYEMVGPLSVHRSDHLTERMDSSSRSARA